MTDPKPSDDPHQHHLEQLRQWREPTGTDQTLSFLNDYVTKRIEKPHKQVAALVEAWQQLVPQVLIEKTVLAKFQRGVLTVHVADSAVHYQLDRLLRGGLDRQFKQASGVSVRSIHLKVVPLESFND